MMLIREVLIDPEIMRGPLTRALRYARKLAKSHAEAEDYVQEAIVLLLRKDLAYEGPAQTTRLLQKMIRDIHASTARRRIREQIAEIELELLDAPNIPGPEDFADLELAVQKLTLVERETVTARYLENTPSAVIAEQRGVSEQAVRKTLRRALDKLRGWMVG